MSNKIATAAAIAVTGVNGSAVKIEATVSSQLPGMVIIGLADTALHEAKQRVRLACANSELPLSKRFLTVNLSPAELPKYGSGFDLGIALSCLAASGTAPDPATANCVFIGELGLDGSVKHISGLFAAVLAAKQQGYTKVMVAAAAAAEAALVPGITVVPVSNLRQAVRYLETGRSEYAAPKSGAQTAAAMLPQSTMVPDLADIVGQEKAVRALIIAAAGRHNLAMWGPPGSGKTMLARALSGILPPLDAAAALTCSSIAAVCGQRVTQLVQQAPFVAPHHSASTASLLGSALGKGNIQPGDITRAHHGVLFLDEAPEFSIRLLDALRQPLECGNIIIQRAKTRAQLPADFQLVLAANPCPCGNAGNPLQSNHNPCICSPAQQQRYLAKISGPLADRIDIRMRLQPVQFLNRSGDIISSTEAQRQVAAARKRQQQRFAQQGWCYNSQTPGSWLRLGPGRLAVQHTAVLDAALQQGKLTLRGYDRVLRVAWTIADLAGATQPEREHIATALSLRGEIV